MFDNGIAALRWMFPVLLLCGLIEGVIYHWKRRRSFDWGEYGASLVIAAGNRMTGLATRGLSFGLLLWVWQHRLYTIPMKSVWALPLLFLMEELAYYWEHRFNHRVRWAWATHAVHHSPSELRLSASYRLGWTSALSPGWLFFVPVVLLGFHPAAVGAMLGINLLYQFWLHNEWMPKLGPLEWILNTPSHHRVHHASNPAYLDRNYGGVLIVYDRLFGTFAEEIEACRYGLVHPVGSRNPFVIVFHEWRRLWRDLRSASNWQQRLDLVWREPGWEAPESAEAGVEKRKGRYQVAAANSDQAMT